METGIVYKEKDNAIDLLLKADGVVHDLSDTTKVELVFEDGSTVNSTASGEMFDFSSYATSGILVLKLGDLDKTAAFYSAQLVLYDATNTDGIVWGRVPLEFRDV